MYNLAFLKQLKTFVFNSIKLTDFQTVRTNCILYPQIMTFRDPTPSELGLYAVVFYCTKLAKDNTIGYNGILNSTSWAGYLPYILNMLSEALRGSQRLTE